MNEEFITFQNFNDIALANALGEKLNFAQIAFKIERAKPILDKVYTGSVLEQDILVKLSPADFEKANYILDKYYDEEIKTLDPSYFIFEFTDKELFDVIAHYDEWGPMNVRLARKVLKDKGYEIDALADEVKKQRVTKLSEPEKVDNTLLIIAYICTLVMPPIAFFIGRYLYYTKRVLPTGAIIFSFFEKDRLVGQRIMIVSGIMFIIVSIILLTEYFFDRPLFY